MVFKIPRIFGIFLIVSLVSLVSLTGPLAMAAAGPVLHGSGTGYLIRHLQQMHQRGSSSLAISSANGSLLSGRVYLTPHFAIHYTLAPNIHRPTLTAADSAYFLPKLDSILATLPNTLTPFQRDSTLNAAFPDTTVAPVYAQRAGVYFEKAWSYYQDTLQMMMPPGGATDQVFSHQSDTNYIDSSRYTVDICDITTANPDEAYSAIYGLTFPPGAPSGASYTLLENDFIYINDAGHDTAIVAMVNNQVLHDYSVDWDQGIKVTAAHEFSHAVHLNYAYNSNPDYNDWYELSATAMEEVLAPEVDDYLQYLPCIFQQHQVVRLIDPVQDGATQYDGTCVSEYDINSYFGNGIFAQYLYQYVDKKFDAKIWANLRTIGSSSPDPLQAALQLTFQQEGKNWDSVYSAYTAMLATATNHAAGSVASCTDSLAPIFLRDLPCWPLAGFELAPGALDSVNELVSPLTFRLFRPPALPTTPTRISLNTLNDAVPQTLWQTGAATPMAGNPIPFFPSQSGAVLGLTVPNGSFSQSGAILAATVPAVFSAFPNNPISSHLDPAVYFFAGSNFTTPHTLTIVSESGRQVAALPLDPGSESWTWNLEDPLGRPVPAGVYYFSTSGQAAKPLLVLPH